MKLCGACLSLAAVLFPIRANGVLQKQTAHAPLVKVAHLLTDVDESVQKEGHDADIVFATLNTYDKQLESSLEREISSLEDMLKKLAAMEEKYSVELGTSKARLKHLGAAAQGREQMASKYEAGTMEAGKKFDQLLDSVKMLEKFLKNAELSADGKLVTQDVSGRNQEPSRVFAAIQRLLAVNPLMRHQFQDVYSAFGTPQRKQKPIKLTQALLGRTVVALQLVRNGLHRQKSEALVQLDSQWHQLDADGASVRATADAQEGVQAENERKAEELLFSVNFTQAVLKMDKRFAMKLHDHMQGKHTLVLDIQASRTKQRNTLKSLIDLLEGKYHLPSALQLPAQDAGTSFLQVAAKAGSMPAVGSQLQVRIETALGNKGDTHAILLRIKHMLGAATAVDSANVQNIIAQMGDVLKAVEGEQSRADEAKRRCAAQKLHAHEGQQELNANLALMSVAKKRTQAAIELAESNLRSIEAKAKALQQSPDDFSSFAKKAMRSLESQQRDRSMIAVALQKAQEVVGHGRADAVPVIALLRQLEQELSTQESMEHSFREQESSFKANFLQYVQHYLQLLKQQRNHYEGSLSALRLYADELSGDSLAQKGSLEESGGIEQESVDLCASILRFYDEHQKRRSELSGTLRKVLPQVFEVFSGDAAVSSDAGGDNYAENDGVDGQESEDI